MLLGLKVSLKSGKVKVNLQYLSHQIDNDNASYDGALNLPCLFVFFSKIFNLLLHKCNYVHSVTVFVKKYVMICQLK